MEKIEAVLKKLIDAHKLSKEDVDKFIDEYMEEFSDHFSKWVTEKFTLKNDIEDLLSLLKQHMILREQRVNWLNSAYINSSINFSHRFNTLVSSLGIVRVIKLIKELGYKVTVNPKFQGISTEKTKQIKIAKNNDDDIFITTLIDRFQYEQIVLFYTEDKEYVI